MADDNGGSAAVRRQIFTVELRPRETTIVSWKKLIKDAARATSSASQPLPQPDSNPVLDSLVCGQPAENELKDGHPSRFGAVIEKIERLYMGRHSSDEEDLNDIPDDDEYDTEDSFIDDAELDDYFQVDNSAIKHDGFFVNRGKLERKNEPTPLPSKQPKKRRRKDLVNNNGEDNEGELPNKLVKVGNNAVGKSNKLVARNIGIPHVVALPSPTAHNEEMNFQNQTTTVICAKKKSAETKTSLGPSMSSNVSNSDAAFAMMGNVDGRNPEILPSENQGNKLRFGVESPNTPVLKSQDQSVSTQTKSVPAILSNSNGELEQSVQWREKDGNHETSDLNVSAGKVPKQNVKALVVQRKEGSTIKPKSTVLEKTIGELEKMVAECRPPSTEVQDDEASQAAGKRRLPRQVKQKLAKVARLAQASHGGIPNELVNRLMRILGHLVQERTLKRNLKDMITMGLTAKKEKDERVQQMKKDVAELIRIRVPYIKSKVLEQQAGGFGDFQEMTKEEKEIIKRKYGMDDAIENKISDLYDLYVDSLDEDAGPQARKLYAELAYLWPKGFMDNHGIKRAICRAKVRRRALYGPSKDQENIKKKKLVAKTEGTVRVDTSTVLQPQHMQEKPASEPNSNSKPVSNTSANPSVGVASSSPNAPNPSHPKQDKVKAKGGSINLNENAQVDVLSKKKMKRKPETELVSGQSRLEKTVSASHKQVVGPLQKPSVSSSVADVAEATKSVSPL